jgi:hypothetical protein
MQRSRSRRHSAIGPAAERRSLRSSGRFLREYPSAPRTRHDTTKTHHTTPHHTKLHPTTYVCLRAYVRAQASARKRRTCVYLFFDGVPSEGTGPTATLLRSRDAHKIPFTFISCTARTAGRRHPCRPRTHALRRRAAFRVRRKTRPQATDGGAWHVTRCRCAVGNGRHHIRCLCHRCCRVCVHPHARACVPVRACMRVLCPCRCLCGVFACSSAAAGCV